MDHMDLLEVSWWVFPSPGFNDCYLHSLHLVGTFFQIDRVATVVTLLVLFSARS